MKSNNIYQAVWLDKDFRRYNMYTQMVFLYLLTNANSAGIVDFDPDIFGFVTKIDEEEITESMKTLKGKDKIVFDMETSEVFLTNHFKYNNPATSTYRHKLKFKSDISVIKSKMIKDEVTKRAKPAIDSVKEISTEAPVKGRATSKFKPVRKPHVDK